MTRTETVRSTLLLAGYALAGSIAGLGLGIIISLMIAHFKH